MQIIQNPAEFTSTSKAIILIIGNFDGVHAGHQTLLKFMMQKKKELNGHTILLTFTNHPAEVLHSRHIPFICSLSQKIDLFQKAGIDTVLFESFTKEFSQQSGEQFLLGLRQYIPFTHLVLGYDTAFGKDKETDRHSIQKIAIKEHFEVHCIDQVFVDGIPVSSTTIRKSIQVGDLKTASKLLGRPYTISLPVIKGLGKGKTLGFPTINLDVSSLVLPPYGIYPALVKFKGHTYKGVANLGVAPTVRQNLSPLLEIYLFDQDIKLYDQEVEVELGEYIRGEQKFKNLEELKEQIAKDVIEAKRQLS